MPGPFGFAVCIHRHARERRQVTNATSDLGETFLTQRMIGFRAIAHDLPNYMAAARTWLKPRAFLFGPASDHSVDAARSRACSFKRA